MARAHRWIEPPPPDGPPPLSSGDRLVDALLHARAITTEPAIRDWLDPARRPAPDPGLLPNMETALARTVKAIDRGERIGIFGDYDADGVTSTAILALALTAATGDAGRVLVRLPERTEGYGLTAGAVDEFAAAGVSLVIAVDCGTNDVEALDRTRGRGLDAIVIDHHQLTREVGESEVIVNPRLGADAAGAELTGAGLAYCFVAGLAREGIHVDSDGDERTYLDLAAVGTIADVGSLTGFNRALVRDGIAQLRRTRRPGLAALVASAGCSLATIDAEGISFKLGPRLNAPGRVDSPRHALNLVMAADPAAAGAYARRVEDLNQRRKAISMDITAQATAQVIDGLSGGVPLVVAHGRGWPVGVVGAVAGKLADTFGVPAIVLADGDDGLSVGSARSVDGFDLFGALSGHRELLTRFGGHRHAAGLTIATADLPRLVGALLEEIVRSGIVTPVPIEHRIDADVLAADLTLATVRSMHRLAPFGIGNPEPLLRLRGARVLQFSRMGADGSHLRVVVGGPGGGIKAAMFGAGARAVELAGRTEIDLLATLEVDTWGGAERLGLKIVDFRPPGG